MEKVKNLFIKKYLSLKISTVYDTHAGNNRLHTIDIYREHNLTSSEVRRLADELALDLAEEFAIDYGWVQDVLHFSRPGVDGKIEVGDSHIRIRARLGLFLLAMKRPIENEIMRVLDAQFNDA